MLVNQIPTQGKFPSPLHRKYAEAHPKKKIETSTTRLYTSQCITLAWPRNILAHL